MLNSCTSRANSDDIKRYRENIMHRLITFLFVFLLSIGVISGAVASDVNTIFELELVPLSEIVKNPTVYDSTMAYRKISVVGNISEIGKHLITIDQDSYEIKVDHTNQHLFAGFNVGDGIKLTGQFLYDPMGTSIFYPNYVMHYPTVQMGEVNISAIISNASKFNGKYVTVTGNLTGIRSTMGAYVVDISSLDTGESLRVSYYGSTDLQAGDMVSVSGLFNGDVLYSGQMGKKRPPLSISTLIPGFTGLWTMFIIGLLVIYMKHE
ncbi:hypothetical protein [Methanomethylovorans sp.]|jgi:hypothetical protein|uniref:hypothetical protein n=1 Tax=Methanomethylovorans sp. TaxID=2758717 RepID=UPI003D0DB310